MPQAIITGSFDDLRSRQVRLLEEAARFGPLHVLLWSDALVESFTGKPPKFMAAEREYFVDAMRYVDQVTVVETLDDPNALPFAEQFGEAVWVVEADDTLPQKQAFASAHNLQLEAITPGMLAGFPLPDLPAASDSGRKKVIVTGCFDWLHTGHVRFFEETAELGDLYVIAGHDANVLLLKGEGHPLFPAEERRYMVQAIRHVTRALISSGTGWMDAEPEIDVLKPDIYAVNEDGDKPEKREFCAQHGLEYVVLKRTPKAGLPRRESTALRGF